MDSMMRVNRYGRAARRLPVLMLLSIVLIAAGCAHKKAYKRATRFSQEGQYVQAIEELETAIRLAEEGNNNKTADRYREELEQTKQRAGQFYYREAELCFGQADLAGRRSSSSFAFAIDRKSHCTDRCDSASPPRWARPNGCAPRPCRWPSRGNGVLLSSA